MSDVLPHWNKRSEIKSNNAQGILRVREGCNKLSGHKGAIDSDIL